MGFVIVTGMSGAGKSQALKMLEDIGYFCIDNLPIPLITRVAGWMEEDNTIENIALGIDSRSGTLLGRLEKELAHLDSIHCAYKILFLDANTEILVKRFKETRRTHPLAGVGRVDKGIEIERKKIAFLKQRADIIIDTSHLLIRDLKCEMDKIFLEGKQYSNFVITVLSFGFKYGIPADADLIFDVRFLPNPYYIPELKKKTGNDKDVYDFVMSSKESGIFLNKLEDMLTFLIPNYIIEGKNELVIGIGCTGGKHRSVTLSRAISKRLEKLEYGLKLEHRDAEK